MIHFRQKAGRRSPGAFQYPGLFFCPERSGKKKDLQNAGAGGIFETENINEPGRWVMNYLAIDIGGTAVKVGLVSEEGKVLGKESYPADFDGYRTPLLETALKGAADFVLRLAPGGGEGLSAAQAAKALGLGGIGISATCLIDTVRGRVAGAHFPNYQGAELKKSFEERFGLETRVVNDANSAALAELWTGNMKGCRDAILITLGTGIGGGIIVNGELLNGAHGFAGEVGHVSIKKDGPLAAYGNRGGYEEYASTKALVKRVEARLIEENRELPVEGLSGRSVFALVAQGDPLVTQVLSEWMDDILVGIENLIYIFDPERIVIGGGISAEEKMLIQPLEKRLKEHLMPTYRADIRVVPAVHHNDAGLIGAVYSFVN